MKGSFFAGIAFGALAGAMLLEASPEMKQLVQQGKQAVMNKISG